MPWKDDLESKDVAPTQLNHILHHFLTVYLKAKLTEFIRQNNSNKNVFCSTSLVSELQIMFYCRLTVLCWLFPKLTWIIAL